MAWHGKEIQPEQYNILCQAKVVQWEEVRVGLDELGVELLQDQPVGGIGGTGDQKGLDVHSPLVSQSGVPAVRESTQATSVPGNPVTRECLHPVPPRQEPRLCGHLLNLPWGGPTGPALGQAKEPGFEVEGESVLVPNLSSQHSRTADLALVLTCILVGCEDSHTEGWGRSYCRQRFFTFQNQDFGQGTDEEKILEACLARILSQPLTLHSCPKREKILRWSWARMGRQPA